MFRKTHDLSELGELGRHVAPRLTTEFERCADLTPYAVGFRYFEAPYEPDAIKTELNLP